MITVNDKWFRILVIVLPVALVLFTNGVLAMPVDRIKIYQSIVSVASTIIICEGIRLLIYRGYNSRLQKGNRGATIELIVIIGGILFTTVILAISKVFKMSIAKGQLELFADMKSSLYVNGRQISFDLGTYSFSNAVINFFFLYFSYKIIFHYARLKQTEKAKEILEKEKLKAELQQLKGIVNPHFLFNNLNSLSALISEDPARAEVFLDELTKIFRYLLRNNSTELTSVAAELQFINSYYHLLQVRYGKSIEMEVHIGEEYLQYLLPPLTLQLLLENAVKHNQLQKDNPLRIELYATAGNKLVMKNNVVKKNTTVESTGIGLQSINARYRMLKENGIMTAQTDQEFSVTIPLMLSQKP